MFFIFYTKQFDLVNKANIKLLSWAIFPNCTNQSSNLFFHFYDIIIATPKGVWASYLLTMGENKNSY